MDTNDLVGERNAHVWAQCWLETITEFPGIPKDEGTMLSWFANAIETGYSAGRKDEQERNLVEKVREVIFQAAGAATRPLLEDHPDYIFPSERVAEAVENVCESFGIPKEN